MDKLDDVYAGQIGSVDQHAPLLLVVVARHGDDGVLDAPVAAGLLLSEPSPVGQDHRRQFLSEVSHLGVSVFLQFLLVDREGLKGNEAAFIRDEVVKHKLVESQPVDGVLVEVAAEKAGHIGECRLREARSGDEAVRAEQPLFFLDGELRVSLALGGRVLNDLERVSRLDKSDLEESRTEVESDHVGSCLARHQSQQHRHQAQGNPLSL